MFLRSSVKFFFWIPYFIETRILCWGQISPNTQQVTDLCCPFCVMGFIFSSETSASLSKLPDMEGDSSQRSLSQIHPPFSGFPPPGRGYCEGSHSAVVALLGMWPLRLILRSRRRATVLLKLTISMALLPGQSRWQPSRMENAFRKSALKA